MSTEEENKRFGIYKKYGVDIISVPKPKYGKLVNIEKGKEFILVYNRTFGFLNYMKKKYVEEGKYESKNLKIKYL